MAERAASRVPRTPSNRSFIEQMIAWGWEPGKSNGTWQSMFSPAISEKQVRVRVKPATQHEANPTTTFLEVYRITCGGDAELFWRGPSDAWLQMLSMERAKAEKRKKDEVAASLTKAAERAERKAAEAALRNQPVRVLALVPEQERGEPVANPKPGDLVRPAKPGTRVASNAVLEVLTDHDGPMTIKTIGEKMGLDMTSQANVIDVSNRCGYLTSKGLAERVMQGTYRVADRAKTNDARIQHDGIHARPAAVAQHQSPAPEVAAVAESMDDVIEAVLDLLLPGGFKAAHLRFIAPWVESTKRMVDAVGRG